MTSNLPANILALFVARDPIPYIAPIEKPKLPPYGTVASYVEVFEDPADSDFKGGESKDDRKIRIARERKDKCEDELQEKLKEWDPANDPNASGDPFHTIFVGRLSYETTESRLRREFEKYGSIKQIKIICDKLTQKPRGYAFIEFERSRSVKDAYKEADGAKIDGRRVVVDVERGRTTPGWRPRRLGGGLGGTRNGHPDINQRSSGREVRANPEESSKDSERDREKDRHKEKDKERDRDRDRDRDREKDRHREKDKDKDRDRDRDRERDRDRDREKDRERDRERDRDRDREKDRDRDREKDRHHRKDRDREHERDRR